MPLLPEFPISGDDYTVGFLTTTAGKKEFNTKDAYLNSFGAVRPGDHIYISTVGKILVIGSITGENSGTLTDPCPDDCAVTDLPVRIFFKTASSRVQGRIAMLLELLSKGYLAAFSEITAKENQIFQATNIDGELKAIDLNADNVAETDKRKFITGDERLKLGKIKADLTAADIAETETRKIMTADERNKLAGIAGLDQTEWNTGKNTTDALISPEKLRQNIVNAFAGQPQAGWCGLPNGLMVQWGVAADRVIFPTAFPHHCAAVAGSMIANSPDYAITVSFFNVSNTGASVIRRYTNENAAGNANETFFYIAVGF